MARLLSRAHDFLTSRLTSDPKAPRKSKPLRTSGSGSIRTNTSPSRSGSVKFEASPRRSESLRTRASKKNGEASSRKVKNTPYKKKQRKEAEAWYKREFRDGFVGSTFVNANESKFGKSVINPTGVGGLVWPSAIRFHVTMHHDEKPARNNGFGFHVTDQNEGYHYYFKRDGTWLETTVPIAVGDRKRSFTINRASNYSKRPCKGGHDC